MKDIIRANGWVSIGKNRADTFFSALDKPFVQHTMMLEVIKGDHRISNRVLVNGAKFSDDIIPTVEEAQEFCDELAK